MYTVFLFVARQFDAVDLMRGRFDAKYVRVVWGNG